MARLREGSGGIGGGSALRRFALAPPSTLVGESQV